MLIIASLLMVIFLIAWTISHTPPSQRLYRMVEEGENSALYLRRIRRADFWGNCGPVHFALPLRIEEYRRITCAPGRRYTRPTSDWYTRTWSEEQRVYRDNYVPLSVEEGHRLWRVQSAVTRTVARKLRRIKNGWEGAAAVAS